LELSEGSLNVTGNAIQLEQAFLNIIANARDAVSGMDRRLILITSRMTDAAVEVTIADSGPGIPEGHEQRIFDPFFTTKEVGDGTGLGLSITYGIVKEHGGEISVHDNEGGGACFVLQLPHARAAEVDQ
jgi:two-component system C4-dicarboxylate transport sensor histidine kinase DctB